MNGFLMLFLVFVEGRGRLASLPLLLRSTTNFLTYLAENCIDSGSLHFNVGRTALRGASQGLAQ